MKKRLKEKLESYIVSSYTNNQVESKEIQIVDKMIENKNQINELNANIVKQLNLPKPTIMP